MVYRREASLAPQGLITTLHSHVLAPLVYCVALGLILGSVGYFCACKFRPHDQFLRRVLPDLAELKFIVVNPLILRVVDTLYLLMIWAACNQGILPDSRPCLRNKLAGLARCLPKVITMATKRNSGSGACEKNRTGHKPGSDPDKSDTNMAEVKASASAPCTTGNRPPRPITRASLVARKKRCREFYCQLIDCLSTSSGSIVGETRATGHAGLVKAKCDVRKTIRASKVTETPDHRNAATDDDFFEIANISLDEVFPGTPGEDFADGSVA